MLYLAFSYTLLYIYITLKGFEGSLVIPSPEERKSNISNTVCWVGRGLILTAGIQASEERIKEDMNF